MKRLLIIGIRLYVYVSICISLSEGGTSNRSFYAVIVPQPKEPPVLHIRFIECKCGRMTAYVCEELKRLNATKDITDHTIGPRIESAYDLDSGVCSSMKIDAWELKDSSREAINKHHLYRAPERDPVRCLQILSCNISVTPDFRVSSPRVILLPNPKDIKTFAKKVKEAGMC